MNEEEIKEMLDVLEYNKKILDEIKDIKNSIQECLKLLGGDEKWKF